MTDIRPNQETLLRREADHLIDEAIKLFRYGYEVSVKVPKTSEEEALYTRQQSSAFIRAEAIGRDIASILKRIARENIGGTI